MSIVFTDNIVALNAVTTTTTSSVFDISKRQLLTIEFVAASITNGNAVFSVDVSNDGTNWITGISFQDAKTTTPTTLVTSKTLSANGTAGAYIRCGWKLIRIVATVTTDGAYSAIIEDAG